MNRPYTSVWTAIALATFAMSGAQAQTPPPPPASTDSGEALEEIVVTAERHEETSQHAAIPLSVISAADLSLANVTRPEGLSQLVPALQATDDTGPYSIFYVRGVGNYAANGLSDPALLVNFDGVTVGRSGTSGLFFDLDRVEVLKGPQGTLYGRNATGGAINILSKQPDLGQFEVEGSFEVGNYSSTREDGLINLPLGTDAALRIAAYHTQHDGYMSDGTDSQDDSGARVSLKIVPSDVLSINVVGDYFHQGGDLSGGTITGLANPFFGVPPSFNAGNRFGFFSPQVESYLTSQVDELNGANFVPFQNVNYENNAYYGIEATVDWKTPVGTVTFIPAFRDRQLDYNSLATGVLLEEQSEERQTTMELRLASDDAQAFRYIVGAYYMNDPDNVPKYDINQEANVTFENYTASTITDALFANLTYAVTPAFRLNAGARWTQDKKDFIGFSNSNSIICQNIGPFGPSCPDASYFPYSDSAPVPPNYIPNAAGTITTLAPVNNVNSETFDKVTWRAGANYDVTSENMLYASVETGFKSGGFFFAPVFEGVADTYKPETITAYTLGSKNRFLDNKLQANLELYYWDYHNQQISHLAEAGPIVYFPTQNIGNSTIKGVELDLQYKLLRQTLLTGDVQYNDADYNSYVYNTPNQNNSNGNGTNCFGPADKNTTATSYAIDCSGKTPPYAPRWTLGGTLQQTIPLPGDGKLVADANVHYQSATLTALEFLPVETQGGYAMWNFDLNYSTAGDHFFVGGYLDNAFDKTALAFSFLTPFSNFSTATLQHPRTFGGRFGIRL